MVIAINKQDFEKCLPVGISAHDSLYEKIAPAIEDFELNAVENILGEPGKVMVQNEDNDLIRKSWINYICISAFLSVLRQLDLVLTSTGFGVISSEKYAPASKMRVDALEGQLRSAQYKFFARLISSLRSPEWGATPQAEENVRYLYNEVYYFANMRGTLDYKDFEAMKNSINRADIILRSKISDAQMDALLKAFRCYDRNFYPIIADIIRFTEILHADGEAAALSWNLPPIYRKLEDDLEKYTEWANSQEYKAFHEERFKNTRDSSAYIFG